MSGIEIAAIVSAAGNLLLGLWGLWKKKKLDSVSDGVLIIEKAVEENKDVIKKIPHGKAVTATIKEYGPVAQEAVNVARRIAREIAGERYAAKIIERERADHAKRELKKSR